METLVINIPEKKSALVKQLLKELGVKINSNIVVKSTKNKAPNALTVETIEKAHKGIGLNKPVININDFIESL
jgi:ABC-type uncharacterized transport system involved in gliding motility auxiliary subunit